METEIENNIKPKYHCPYENEKKHTVFSDESEMSCPLVLACNQAKDKLVESGLDVPEDYCLSEVVSQVIRSLHFGVRK